MGLRGQGGWGWLEKAAHSVTWCHQGPSSPSWFSAVLIWHWRIKKNQENGFSAIKLYSHTLCSCSLVTSTLKVEIQRAMSNLWPQTQGNRFLSLSKASSTEKGFENDPEEDEGAHFRKLCRLFLSRRGFVLLPSQQRFWTFSILCSIPICSKQSPRGYVSLYS